HDRLFRFAETQRIATGTVLLRDHSVTQAHTDTTAGASSARSEHRLHTTYEYLPARPVDVQPHIGRVALEQLRRDERVYAGEASAPHLSPGHAFKVERRSDASLDGTYVVTSLRTHGRDPQFMEEGHADAEALIQELDAVRATDAF